MGQPGCGGDIRPRSQGGSAYVRPCGCGMVHARIVRRRAWRGTVRVATRARSKRCLVWSGDPGRQFLAVVGSKEVRSRQGDEGAGVRGEWKETRQPASRTSRGHDEQPAGAELHQFRERDRRTRLSGRSRSYDADLSIPRSIGRPARRRNGRRPVTVWTHNQGFYQDSQEIDRCEHAEYNVRAFSEGSGCLWP